MPKLTTVLDRTLIKLAPVGLVLAVLVSYPAQAAGPAATIAELDWMTGNYAADLGGTQLEENWIKAEGGSIAAMVRMTGNGTTGMFEMITIEEVDGSLVLHIQQWDPGFQPRTDEPQRMELSEIGDNRVQFVATSEGGMAALGYSKQGNTFTIHVGQESGQTVDIPLQERRIWD